MVEQIAIWGGVLIAKSAWQFIVIPTQFALSVLWN